MATNLNIVALTGRLTKDPELRSTGSGKAVAQMRIAVNKSVKDGDNWKDEPSFFNVIVWENLAERAAAKLSKGTFLTVSGRLQQREYEHEGQKREAIEIVADRIETEAWWADGNGAAAPAAADAGAAAAAAATAADDDIPF
jgi:single-strand DNA-binding protein